MPKSARIDPLVHYSRRVRELEAELRRYDYALHYLAGMASPYIGPNADPEELAQHALVAADRKNSEKETPDE